MKGPSRRAIKYAEDHGYLFERQNTKGVLYYRNADGHEVGIGPSIDDRNCRQIVVQIDRACGVGPDLSQKRHPDEIKARRERERLLLKEERARHHARLEELTRQKSALLLGGLGDALTIREVRAIEALIEAERKHHRGVVRLMTAVTVAS